MKYFRYDVVTPRALKEKKHYIPLETRFLITCVWAHAYLRQSWKKMFVLISVNQLIIPSRVFASWLCQNAAGALQESRRGVRSHVMAHFSPVLVCSSLTLKFSLSFHIYSKIWEQTPATSVQDPHTFLHVSERQFLQKTKAAALLLWPQALVMVSQRRKYCK